MKPHALSHNPNGGHYNIICIPLQKIFLGTLYHVSSQVTIIVDFNRYGCRRHCDRVRLLQTNYLYVCPRYCRASNIKSFDCVIRYTYLILFRYEKLYNTYIYNNNIGTYIIFSLVFNSLINKKYQPTFNNYKCTTYT